MDKGLQSHPEDQYRHLHLHDNLRSHIFHRLTNNSADLCKKLIVAQLIQEFPPFIELEGSLLFSQEPTTDIHPELDQRSPKRQPCFLKIDSNIAFTSMPRSSEWSLTSSSS